MSARGFERTLIWGAVISAALLLALGCASSRPEPLEIRDARLSLQDARNAGADRLAPQTYAAAEGHLRRAEGEWARHHDVDDAVHYARLAEAEARDAQYRAVAVTTQQAIETGGKRTAELEIAVRDAELRAQQRRSQTEAERQRIEAEARVAEERRRAEAAQAAREGEQRAAAEEKERTRALQAQLDAERQKSVDQQRQAEIDRLRAEVDAEKRNADEARRQAADREKAQADLIARLQLIEKTTRVDTRGIVVTLPGNVYFETSRSDVKPAMRDHLSAIGRALASASDRRVIVEGHTDSTGSVEFNTKLSELRAEAVKSILVTNGVSPDRIEVHGYAATKPVASNATAAGRSQNRRVEVIIQGTYLASK
ncbi:MAG TPA: OmpA family protein [Thermoanaerobaculia bacterium]|nr:OmpA family protein [Thermoanaerobaculia bacterium]